MLPAHEIHRELVLVGGGHAHALALRMLAMRPIEGLRISLISPASHTPYSGMLPGLVAGHYNFEQTHIDLARLCQWARVRFIAAEVTALDPQQMQLSLAGRPPVYYDLLSLDIGSQPELDSVPGARAHAVPVKPVAGLWQRWQVLRERVLARAPGTDYRIAVVGGGAGSVELAMAMANSLATDSPGIDLWCGAADILQNYNKRARSAVVAALARQGVNVHLGARVERVEGDALFLAGGKRVSYDDLFWCTGAAAAPWVAASGLATDAQGFLAVRDTLQSLDDDRVFGCGDIATQVNNPRPKAGVYAVRQGPVLGHNLGAALLGKPLRQHRPQQRFLSLISLGERLATADRGPFSATGAWVWRWKDRIDREFMGRFEQLPEMMPIRPWGRLPQLPEEARPHCGGCGAKVGGDALATVLAQLAQAYPAHCTGSDDDASVVPVADGQTVLQSVDMLRELVGDPWLMGRIAANHALSDLYACGARPVSALAAITMPFASPEIQQRELQQLLAGALHEFAAVDCRLTGGHSMQGPELNVGFVVNGVTPDSGALLGKRGLRAGDSLLLTKPLGTGTLFAAQMQLRADGRDIGAAIDTMLQSNAIAGELALANGASAATDITGFGLLGHLLEMLGDDLGAELELTALPLLGGALETMRAGIYSTMHAANARSYASLAQGADVDEPLREILFDPQTSGGLLLGIAPQLAIALRETLRERGYIHAQIIGTVAHRETAAAPVVTVHQNRAFAAEP